ncbi:hypothetical protein HMPREF1318_0196 [Actinomyces massiliensis F0489]|uniref:Uncharacterized protein n=1 Tax=Actinomyces massiliensis F0489 TaxID=1125718 RepID=J0NGX5_9ACTO|nr:hypothetical protein HMPREF1318_0196 [Actinomyces massiliensis F0489]
MEMYRGTSMRMRDTRAPVTGNVDNDTRRRSVRVGAAPLRVEASHHSHGLAQRPVIFRVSPPRSVATRVEISSNPCRDRSQPVLRSVATRAEIGPSPARDRSFRFGVRCLGAGGRMSRV